MHERVAIIFWMSSISWSDLFCSCGVLKTDELHWRSHRQKDIREPACWPYAILVSGMHTCWKWSREDLMIIKEQFLLERCSGKSIVTILEKLGWVCYCSSGWVGRAIGDDRPFYRVNLTNWLSRLLNSRVGFQVGWSNLNVIYFTMIIIWLSCHKKPWIRQFEWCIGRKSNG